MADIIQTLKDANGKEIDVNISKICDINGDLSGTSAIKDSAIKNRVSVTHDLQLVDKNGNALDSTKLLSDMSSGKTDIVALDVNMEATHSGKNHNYTIYYEDSMEKDAESFMNPFHKPMLKNHDEYGEPLGRITQSYMGPSELTDERAAIHLTARVTDKESIPKFIDKRYGTVSIGGTMGTVTCNICGKTILKDGKFHFCGHWRGETYKDQVCYWGARDIEYHEVSTVNNPADDFAQIMKITVLTDKDMQQDNNSSKEENSMGGKDSMESNVENIIDETLGSNPENNSGTASVEDQNQGKAPDAGTATDGNEDSGTPNDSEGEGSESGDGEGQEETPKDNGSDARIAELEQQLKDAQEKIETLQTDLIDAQSQIETLKKTTEDARKEANTFKQRCVTLATANKQNIVDNIISKENFESEDAKNERKKDLMIKSMKELNALNDSLKAPAKVRQMASVQNPTLAVEDEMNNGKSNSQKKTDTDKTTDKRSFKTVDDAAQEVIRKLLK